jgi:hypothetical protein
VRECRSFFCDASCGDSSARPERRGPCAIGRHAASLSATIRVWMGHQHRKPVRIRRGPATVRGIDQRSRSRRTHGRTGWLRALPTGATALGRESQPASSQETCPVQSRIQPLEGEARGRTPGSLATIVNRVAHFFPVLSLGRARTGSCLVAFEGMIRG